MLITRILQTGCVPHGKISMKITEDSIYNVKEASVFYNLIHYQTMKFKDENAWVANCQKNT